MALGDADVPHGGPHKGAGRPAVGLKPRARTWLGQGSTHGKGGLVRQPSYGAVISPSALSSSSAEPVGSVFAWAKHADLYSG